MVSSDLVELLLGLNEVVHVNRLLQCLAHNKGSINVSCDYHHSSTMIINGIAHNLTGETTPEDKGLPYITRSHTNERRG